MSSITTWTRLEPLTQDPNMQDGFNAFIHDPHWMLARQWQTGEFRAHDGGSPAVARIESRVRALGRFQTGPADSPFGEAYNPGEMSLETMVERETVPRDHDLRWAAETGQYLLRLLKIVDPQKCYEVDRPVLLHDYALSRPADWEQLDGASRRFAQIMIGRVPDGRLLYSDAKDGKLVPKLSSTQASNVVDKWVLWYESLVTQPAAGSRAWDAERMEYSFQLQTESSTSDVQFTLAAPEYTSGHLDWHDLDYVQTSGPVPSTNAEVRFLLPQNVSFAGMPLQRFWTMEDAKVDFGAVDPGEGGLARLLFMEHMLAFGNDWFVIPFEMKVGQVCEMEKVEVRDGFGIFLEVKHYSEKDGGDSPWRLYCLSDFGSLDGRRKVSKPRLFFLPASLGPSLQGPDLEEVRFRRDEYANLGWAIERLVESASGRPLDRFEAWQEQRQRKEETQPAGGGTSPSSAPLVYRLGTPMPPHWIPLMPVRDPANPYDIRFDRGALPGMDVSSGPMLPLGRILEPENPLRLYEEEVPREGARVTRAFQYARWINGAIHLWIGRRKIPGRGEASSGLRFDFLEPPSQT